MRDGIAAAERCLALNPTYAGAYMRLALLHFFLAHPDKMLEYADRGIRLSPRDPQTSTFLLFKGWAYIMLEQDEEGSGLVPPCGSRYRRQIRLSSLD